MVTLHRQLVFVVLALVASVLAVTAMSQPAWACSPFDSFSLRLEYLEGASTLAELEDDDGPLAVDVRSFVDRSEDWSTDYLGDDIPPPIDGVWKMRTVAYFEAPDGNYAGDAGVTVYEAIWGVPPTDTSARSWPFDTSSCAGEDEPPPIGAARWRIMSEPGGFYETFSSDEAALDAALTRLFGPPIVPERNVAQEQRRADQLMRSSLDAFGKPPGSVALSDGLSDGVLGTDDGRESPFGAVTPGGLLSLVVLVILGGLFAWRSRS